MYRFLTLLLILTSTLSLSAQKVWSLEECIQYARQNSLTAKQTIYNNRSAELTLKQ
jgi:hypothetical protein